ncbi:MAG: hypothetical protein R2864_02195 [Syntrophotaleaceae bacterium]
MPLDTLRLLAVKCLLLPVAVFALYHYCWPEYQLAALLMAGASTAVLAPFFARLFRADVGLTAAVVILSSLLLPFTLPPLVAGLAGRHLQVGVGAMIQMLALMVFVPALAGRACIRWLPRPADWLLGRSYPLSLLAVALTNLGVFSRYSHYFRQNAALALEAMAAGTLLVTMVLLAGPLLFRGTKPEFRATALVCTVFPNYILILAFGSQFFGPAEATFAATYSVPFFLQVLVLRKLIAAPAINLQASAGQ